MKVKEEKTSGASPSDKAMAAIQTHKPNHEVAASVDAAAHGQSPVHGASGGNLAATTLRLESICHTN